MGISRQALHAHLRVLLEERRIEKHGAGPHVTYALAVQKTSRVGEDYERCRTELLPLYREKYGDLWKRFLSPHATGKGLAADVMDLQFLLDASSVYSSNIEGNTLDLNSFLNSRLAPRKHRAKEAVEIEDLVTAYEYARSHPLTERHMLHAHGLLSGQFVAPSRQGCYRQEPVGVFSQAGLEYMAVEPHLVEQEMHALFAIMPTLLSTQASEAERCFWATWVHLMIALIHPFSDGNGRTARLCEKWFLVRTCGEHAFVIQSEEAYWCQRPQYYRALKLGVNYWEADLGKAMPFFSLLPDGIGKEQKR